MMMFLGVIERPNQATCDIPCGWLQAEEEVVGVVFVAGVQDIPGGDLQGIVLGAGNRAAGSHLEAAGNPALLRGVLLQRGPYAAAAQLRIGPEGLNVTFFSDSPLYITVGLPASAPST
jgi:hypothetical protein